MSDNTATGLIVAAAIVGAAYWAYSKYVGQQQGAAFNASFQAAQGNTAGLLAGGNGGTSVLGTIQNAFSGVTSMVENTISSVPGSVSNPNVQAFLHLIREGEGTSGPDGYSMLFGGGHFASFAHHPNVAVPFGNTYSTAAGAYQFLHSTWEQLKSQYGLPDFGPASQDVAAVGLLKQCGALGDVKAGLFKSAIEKANKIWASLPDSPYGQPTLTMADAGSILAGQGVQINEAMA